MHEKRIPEWLRHAPAPGVRGFAVLAGLEATARGILISVFPLVMYQALGDAALVSKIYFLVGVASLLMGLSVPYITRHVPRRFVYSLGALMFVAGSLVAIPGTPVAVVTGLALNTFATVVCFICFNAYVLDYIARVELGRCETLRLFYSALGWTVGPVLGVVLLKLWWPAPFLIAALAASSMLAVFLYLRLGNGRLIQRARGPAANPLAYLGRFASQPRLIAGWLFAVLRSCGWWVYVVYLPIYAVDSGLGDRLGGIMLSLTNAALFATPLILRWLERRSVRRAVRSAFLLAGLLFSATVMATAFPPAVVALLFAGSLCLIALDVCAGLPFLMAVKPSERTEMSAVYSSYRDVSGILTPGAAWAILLVAPVSAVFLASGLGLLIAFAVAGAMHPRLGQPRNVLGRVQPALPR